MIQNNQAVPVHRQYQAQVRALCRIQALARAPDLAQVQAPTLAYRLISLFREPLLAYRKTNPLAFALITTMK